MELAYRLAVSEQPMIKAIRNNVVVLINPVAEPDGRDRFVDWFYRYLKGKTDYDTLPPVSPPYWGRYVYHDNNRDATSGRSRPPAPCSGCSTSSIRWPSTTCTNRSPPPDMERHGPVEPESRPDRGQRVVRHVVHRGARPTAMGMPGVWTWAFGEGFGHHYTESVATNHNAIGRGYETFGNASAETMERNLRDRKYMGRPVTEKEWYRPLPPPRKFAWSLRNNTNYMETGCLAILTTPRTTRRRCCGPSTGKATTRGRRA